MYAIECQQVSKAFSEAAWWKKERKKRVAVDRVSLQVKAGEIFGILGPNGSGKSTLIRMLSTLLVPDSGQILIFGHDVVSEAQAVRHLLNRVSVDPAFFKKLSVMENLSYTARLYGLSPRASQPLMVEILERFGLQGKKLHESIQDMSRGMQQKVAIARGFLTVPPVLLLDEPTTGLDPVSRKEVQIFVEEVRQTHETTIILTTHNMQETDNLCDRIAIIHEGRIVALDTPEQLKRSCGSKDGNQALTLEDAFFQLTDQKLKNNEEVLSHAQSK